MRILTDTCPSRESLGHLRWNLSPKFTQDRAYYLWESVRWRRPRGDFTRGVVENARKTGRRTYVVHLKTVGSILYDPVCNPKPKQSSKGKTEEHVGEAIAGNRRCAISIKRCPVPGLNEWPSHVLLLSVQVRRATTTPTGHCKSFNIENHDKTSR